MPDRPDDDSMYADAIGPLLADQVTPARIRAIEAGASGPSGESVASVEAGPSAEAGPSGESGQAGNEAASELWSLLDASGFADALVPQAEGGAGLGLGAIFDVWRLCGRHALPLPLAETMVARALLVAAGLPRPAGPVALAEGRLDEAGELHCSVVPLGQVAASVLVQHDGGWSCLPALQATAEPAAFCLDRRMRWPAAIVAAAPRPSLPRTLAGQVRPDLANARANTDASATATAALTTAPTAAIVPLVRSLQACLIAAQAAGALGAVFERTLQYANDRVQFGRPIGKFQAIQHQLAVMSEHVVAARMAARLGCRDEGGSEPAPQASIPQPSLLGVAIAKARTSQAALVAADTSHAIHGALGFTAEHDLQLLTRRLHNWRQLAGAESYWHDVAGRLLVDTHQGSTLDLLRSTTDLHEQATTT